MAVLEDMENKKVPINVALEIRHQFRQDEKKDEGVGTCVQVLDISRDQVTFKSPKSFIRGFYFESKLDINREDCFNTVIRILNCHEVESGEYLIQSEFIGLEPFLADKINYYKKRLLAQNQEK